MGRTRRQKASKALQVCQVLHAGKLYKGLALCGHPLIHHPVTEGGAQCLLLAKASVVFVICFVICCRDSRSMAATWVVPSW